MPRVAQVLVCDRRGEPQHGNKADWADAEQLADRLRRGDLRAVYHGSPHRAVLKELARTYRNLIEDSTRVMSRLKALFRARGIKTPGKSVYHAAQRAQLLGKLSDEEALGWPHGRASDRTMVRAARPERLHRSDRHRRFSEETNVAEEDWAANPPAPEGLARHSGVRADCHGATR